MNGARRRLETTLSVESVFRRRFECQTFDVFARTITARRRSLLRGNAEFAERTLDLNEFDRPAAHINLTVLMADGIHRTESTDGQSAPQNRIRKRRDCDCFLDRCPTWRLLVHVARIPLLIRELATYVKANCG